jgi:hypothetical protein
MQLSRRSEPFDSDLFMYELKVDGFRALAHVEAGKGELVSWDKPYCTNII